MIKKITRAIKKTRVTKIRKKRRMVWLSATSKGDEYGLIENITGYAAIDRHFVIHTGASGQNRTLYLRFFDPNDAKKVREQNPQFQDSGAPPLRGKWLEIDTKKDYPEILKLLPNTIVQNYRVDYHLVKSYGVVNSGDYEAVYIQFYDDKHAEEIKDLLQKKYGIQSKIVTL